MEYLNFDLEISPGSGNVYPTAVRLPAGAVSGAMRFPFDRQTLELYLSKLEAALLRSRAVRRQVMLPQETVIRDFGAALFDALIVGDLRALYDQQRAKARQQGMGVRIRLLVEAPDLATLPWEYLRDPREADFLCLSPHTPLVRYVRIPQPMEPIKVQPPLRILGMVASPSDQDPLDVAGEKERLSAALQHLEAQGVVKLDWVQGQTWQALQEALWRGWHVFHFIGHGAFNPRVDEGMLALADFQGKTHLLPGSQLGRLLANSSLRLVVLNACEGAKGSDRDIFSSAGASLVRREIPAVVAMQAEISDDAALEFTRTFYKALAYGIPVDAALSEARTAIWIKIQNTLEWGTPVLYLRAPDGVLFALPQPQFALSQSQPEADATLYGVLNKTKEQWLEEGHSRARSGRLEEALHAYQQAIQIDPNDAVSHRRKGYILNQLKRYEEALTALDEAIRLDPNSANSYAARAEALSGLQRHQEALAVYQRALELNPALPNAQAGRDRMQQLLASRSPIKPEPAGPSLPVAENPAPGASISATPPPEALPPKAVPAAPAITIQPQADQAAQPTSPKPASIWTQGFTMVFVLAAIAGGVLTLIGIGGANASTGTNMTGDQMGLLAGIALVVVCLVGLRFATSALMRVGFLFQLLTAIAGIIVWAVLQSSDDHLIVGSSLDVHSHLLLAVSLLNLVSLIGVSYALVRWQPVDGGLTVLQLMVSIILTALFWNWFMGAGNVSFAKFVSIAEYVAIFACAAFSAALLVFRLSCWRRQPVVILCLAVANVLWAVFNFNLPISLSLVYALVLAFVWLSVLGFLALVQVERVKKASMVR